MDRGLYCYQVMPFGAKNINAKYQRFVRRKFKDQIGWNMEVYVKYLLVKSKKLQHHLEDLCKAFAVLQQYMMKLNLTKCSSE